MNKYLQLLIVLPLFFACKPAANRQSNTLTVTIAPQAYFLKKLVGERFTINTLVPPSASPETYEPAPSTMLELGRSKIYFKVGFLGFENAWSKKLAENNPDVQIVDCSEGVNFVMSEHAHSHDHDEECDHDHHHGDPHIWSSPANALIIADNMRKALIEIDPKNAAEYDANYTALANEISVVNIILRQKLANLPSRSFIIYHPSLSYFAHDYNLQQHSIEFEGKSPSPGQLKQVIDLAAREGIKTIFIEQGFDIKNAEVVAKEIGGEVFTINPLAEAWDEELIRIADILAREQ